MTERNYVIEQSRIDGKFEVFCEYDENVVDVPPAKANEEQKAHYGPRVKHQRPSLGVFDTKEEAEARVAEVKKQLAGGPL